VGGTFNVQLFSWLTVIEANTWQEGGEWLARGEQALTNTILLWKRHLIWFGWKECVTVWSQGLTRTQNRLGSKALPMQLSTTGHFLNKYRPVNHLLEAV